VPEELFLVAQRGTFVGNASLFAFTPWHSQMRCYSIELLEGTLIFWLTFFFNKKLYRVKYFPYSRDIHDKI